MPATDPGTRKEVAPQPTPQEPSAPAVTAPPAIPEPATPPEGQSAGKKVQGELPRPVPSVLEKFRLFSGEKTPGNLVGLFDREPGATFSQTPPICIADGKSSVKVTIARVPGDTTPTFSLSSARYVSLEQADDGGWQLVVTPDRGALRASVRLQADGAQVEIPLTVAPRADVVTDKTGRVSAADFLLFLKTRGSESAPKGDLNGDGRRDYLDDYIYTANFLALQQGGEKKEIPAQPKP